MLFRSDVFREKCKTILKPISGIPRIKQAKRKYSLIIRTIDKLKETDTYDCIFATYGNLENVWGGMYAANAFRTKFIMDFRDLIVWYHDPYEILWNLYSAAIQKKVLEKADVITTVSEGLSRKLRTIHSDTIIHTLYNGYEKEQTQKENKSDRKSVV